MNTKYKYFTVFPVLFLSMSNLFASDLSYRSAEIGYLDDAVTLEVMFGSSGTEAGSYGKVAVWGDSDLKIYQANAGYHMPMSDKTDWIIEGGYLGIDAGDWGSDSGYNVSVGIRNGTAAGTEFTFKIGRWDVEEAITVAEARANFKINDTRSWFIGAISVDSETEFHVGFRFDF